MPTADELRAQALRRWRGMPERALRLGDMSYALTDAPASAVNEALEAAAEFVDRADESERFGSLRRVYPSVSGAASTIADASFPSPSRRP